MLAHKGFTPKYGARQVAGVIRNYLRRPISRLIINEELGKGKSLEVGLDEQNRINLEYSPIIKYTMFGYTVFLKIGNLAASSLTDMYKDSYQLIGCEFGFAQGIDIKGQAQTEVKGGTFYVTYPHLPNRDMIQWMLDARKYQSGAIVVHDNQGSTLEKILFEKATCVDMEISYIRQGKSYIATKLTVQAQKLAFGTEEFENQWVF